MKLNALFEGESKTPRAQALKFQQQLLDLHGNMFDFKLKYAPFPFLKGEIEHVDEIEDPDVLFMIITCAHSTIKIQLVFDNDRIYLHTSEYSGWTSIITVQSICRRFFIFPADNTNAHFSLGSFNSWSKNNETQLWFSNDASPIYYKVTEEGLTKRAIAVGDIALCVGIFEIIGRVESVSKLGITLKDLGSSLSTLIPSTCVFYKAELVEP